MHFARNREQRLWWLTMIRGLLIAGLGMIALFWPGLPVTTLALAFGGFAIADGLLAVMIGQLYRSSGWGWAFVEGIIDVGVGALVIWVPLAAADQLVLALASWTAATGVIQLVVADRQRDTQRGSSTWIAILGVTGTATGAFLLLNRGVGVAMVGTMVGLLASVIGGVRLFGAYRLFRTRPRPRAAARPQPVTVSSERP